MRDITRTITASVLLAVATTGCAGLSDLPVEEFRAAHGDFLRDAISGPLVQLRWTEAADAELEGEEGDFDLEQWVLEALVPIPLSRDSFLIGGVYADRRRYEFHDVPGIEDDVLWRYGVNLGYGRFLDDDLVVQGIWQPGVYSDHDESLESRDLRWWYGTGLAIWRQHPALFWKLGLTLNDAVDTGVIPLVGVVWHLGGNVRFETLLPRDVKLVWRPDERWILSGGLLIASEEYHLRGPAALGHPEHDVHVQERVLFVEAEGRWTEHLSTFVRVGTPLGGNYDWSYGGGLPEYEGELDEGSFVTVGLGLRF